MLPLGLALLFSLVAFACAAVTTLFILAAIAAPVWVYVVWVISVFTGSFGYIFLKASQ